MSRASYFTDRTHVFIAGVTGARTDYGGKTALANWWLAEPGKQFDLRVFLNVKRDQNVRRVIEGRGGETVNSIGALGDAMADGARYLNIEPTTHEWEAFHADFRTFVANLPEDMSKLVAHDEAPELDEDALAWFVRVAGNGNATKSLVIAQAPGDLPTSIRRQTMTAWVGPVTEQNRHYFRANGYENHYRTIRETHQPYHWSILTGPGEEDLDHYQPVPEEFA